MIITNGDTYVRPRKVVNSQCTSVYAWPRKRETWSRVSAQRIKGTESVKPATTGMSHMVSDRTLEMSHEES